jgi:glutathione S-transferase
MSTERVIYQFPISHFCEKARWNLDAKGLSYRIRNIAPGPHRKLTRRLGGTGSVPVLTIDGVGFGDSTNIFRRLEEHHPYPPLLPADPALRREAEGFEAQFSADAGPAIRLWLWGTMLETPGAAARAFFHGYPLPARLLGRLVHKRFEVALRRLYRITAEKMVAARQTVDAALARLDAALAGNPQRYLVGDSFSIADITVASLLAPMVVPPGSPWDFPFPAPAAINAARDALVNRPAGQWVLERYRVDRHRRPRV